MDYFGINLLESTIQIKLCLEDKSPTLMVYDTGKMKL